MHSNGDPTNRTVELKLDVASVSATAGAHVNEQSEADATAARLN